jgi:hypothetical protein
MLKPHVILVTTGYPYINSVVRVTNIARGHGCDAKFVTCEPISLAREQAVVEFLESDATHLLLVEQHLLPPEDLAVRLAAAGADVATAAYPTWDGERLSVSVQSLADRAWPATVPSSVFRVRVALPGVLLVARRVVENQPGPWFSQGRVSGQGARSEAEHFSEKVRRAGFTFVCDGRIEIGHWRHGIDLLQVSRERRRDVEVAS